MKTTQDIFALIDANDLSSIEAALEEDPALVFVKHADPDLFHWSTLQYAAARGKLDVCRLLVERGAEVYTNPMNSYPPVTQAAWNGHQEIVDYFLKEIPDKAQGTNRLGVMLNLAAREGWTEIVKEHIARDPLAVYQRGWIGDSPLHWPSHNNHAEIVSLLLDAGAEIEADEVNCYGGKPLHWASEHAPDSVRVLLDRGANVNSRNVKEGDFYMMTPLIMNSCQKDDCAAVTEMLIDCGAEVEAVDGNGMTALDHARKIGNEQIEGVLRKKSGK